MYDILPSISIEALHLASIFQVRRRLKDKHIPRCLAHDFSVSSPAENLNRRPPFANPYLKALGPHPAFLSRLRAWVRQTLAFEFQVSEFLGPVPVVAKEQEAKLITTPKPFTCSAHRAPALATAASSSPTWAEMRSIMARRREVRRRQGWNNLRKRHQMHAKEESMGLLAVAD